MSVTDLNEQFRFRRTQDTVQHRVLMSGDLGRGLLLVKTKVLEVATPHPYSPQRRGTDRPPGQPHEAGRAEVQSSGPSLRTWETT